PPLTLHGFECRRGKTVFAVAYGDLPAVDFDAIPVAERLRGAQQGMLQKAPPDHRVVREQAISLDGHPGREFAIESKKAGDAVFRVYLVRQRFYTLMAGG